MAFSRNHSTTADATFSATGKTNWEAAHALSGAVSGGIPYFDSTTSEATSLLLTQNNMVVGGGAGAAPATTSLVQATPGGTSVTIGDKLILNKATAFTSNLFVDFQNNGTSYCRINDSGYFLSQPGDINHAAFGSQNTSGTGVYFPANGTVALLTGALARVTADTTGQVYFNGLSGAATMRAEINKAVTAIANNTATATLTVTVPNGAHSAGGRITFKGAAGAGGAIGADEFTALVEYDWTVTRTTGVNAVATLSAALLTAITSSVAGGATPTISAVASAIAGAVGAANTFTFNVTINALTGASTNHTCFCYATLINDNASGVTIA